MGGAISFSSQIEIDDKNKKDDRRRNSLAYNIKRFNDWEEDDYTPLVDEVRNALIEQGIKKEKITKFSRMAENILRGNNRELKVSIEIIEITEIEYSARTEVLYLKMPVT